MHFARALTEERT